MMQQPTRPSHLAGGLIIVLVLLFASKVSGLEVTLGWDANPEPDIAGYKVHVGSQSRQYDSVLEAGFATEKRVEALLPGQTYYFAVSACSSNGTESDLSDEVAYTTPGSDTNAWILPLNLWFSPTLRVPVLSFTATPGQQCSVQASEDLRSWQTIRTMPVSTAGLIEWTDMDALQYSKRFYRTLVTSP